MICHENFLLLADNSHKTSCLICYFGKSSKIRNCHLLQIVGGAFWVKAYQKQLTTRPGFQSCHFSSVHQKVFQAHRNPSSTLLSVRSSFRLERKCHNAMIFRFFITYRLYMYTIAIKLSNVYLQPKYLNVLT